MDGRASTRESRPARATRTDVQTPPQSSLLGSHVLELTLKVLYSSYEI
jgi:hypothetical protein